MFRWIKKHYKLLIILTDVMIIPGMLLCRWLTENMLATNNPCMWTLLGGKCITCGGTHFVNDLCNLRILDALADNPFLFFTGLYLAVSFVFLNLWWVFGLTFFKKVLKKMFNIPVLIVWLVIMVLFLLVRNIPTAINIYHILSRR